MQAPSRRLYTRLLHHRHATSYAGPPPSNRRRSKFVPAVLRKPDEKSEWWVVDGEMHEVGDNVPHRERFVIPRDNFPNKKRKQMREQFMRRTRLVIKDNEHEPWCRRYLELYRELRENWERLYWDEGYSKKLAQDRANYDSAEDDDKDFSPYRRRPPRAEQMKQDQGTGRNWQVGRNLESGRNWQGDNWENVSQIRDKFEYDRERRMRDKAFAPMNGGVDFIAPNSGTRNQPFDANRYLSQSDSD